MRTMRHTQYIFLVITTLFLSGCLPSFKNVATLQHSTADTPQQSSTSTDETRDLGDINSDGHVDVIEISKGEIDAGDFFRFVQTSSTSTVLPPLPQYGSSCLHLTDVYPISDMNEDGILELAVYESSCASRYKAIRVYSLTDMQWQEIGHATYDVGYPDPPIPDRITKVKKNEFTIREIMTDSSSATAPVLDHEVHFIIP